jgi:uncharacterized membrane protein
MNFRALSFLCILFFTLTSQATALEISYDITIALSEKMAHETVTITVNNTKEVALEDFSYELPGDAHEILIYDEVGELSPEITYDELVIIYSKFRTPIQPNSLENLTIEFDTSELVSSLEGDHIFSTLFTPPPGSTKKMTLRIVLPKGMGLPNPISSGARTDIAPIPDNTLSDGTTTSFLWNVDQKEDFAVFVRYSSFAPPTTTPSTAVTLVASEDSNKTIYFLVLSMVMVILVGVYLYIRKLKRAEGKTEFMKTDEKQIINLIKENEGLVQKRLVDSTGFSKAKISKIVSELENRKIVRIERIGRRNKLFLTEEFKKK